MREAKRLVLLRRTGHVAMSNARVKRNKWSKTINAMRGSYAERLLQAGIMMKQQHYLALIFSVSLLVALLLSKVGILLALFVSATLAQYLAFSFVTERIAKRRFLIIPQIPTFIDALTTALGTGFSLEAAIAQAAQAIPPGLLRSEVERAVQGINQGLSIDEAFGTLKQRISGKEITSIAIALSLFYGMGGRMLEPFKRLAAKVRDEQKVVEKALRELVQIKLAFTLLLGLSLLMPVLIFLIRPEYILNAAKTEIGMLMFQVALLIEWSAILIFKHLTTIRI